MGDVVDSQPAPLTTYEQLAKAIDHAIVRPELTEQQVTAHCEMAKSYGVGCVIVRPCDLDIVLRLMAGSGVTVGSVAGFPHGDGNTATKLYETRDLLRRGAREIDFVINVAKLLSRQFQYVEMELLQAAEACHKEGASLKVIFENAYLNDEMKIVACRMCSRADANFAVTSTGFAPHGYTPADVTMMRAKLPDDIGVKAAGGIRTLAEALAAHRLGCARIGTTATAAILDDWKTQLREAAKSPSEVS